MTEHSGSPEGDERDAPLDAFVRESSELMGRLRAGVPDALRIEAANYIEGVICLVSDQEVEIAALRARVSPRGGDQPVPYGWAVETPSYNADTKEFDGPLVGDDDLYRSLDAAEADAARFKGIVVRLYLHPPALRSGRETLSETLTMASALAMAAKWFREYEEIHRAKHSPDDGGSAFRNEKAERNRERAEFCEAALRSGSTGSQGEMP